MRTPSIAELRAVGQPESVLGRVNAEHWLGRLYGRRVSPYLTRELIRTPISANGVTWLMILAGLLAALVLTLPGVAPAVATVLLVQLQLILDCSDGEVARWRETLSPAGVYLDRIGHYTTEAALPAALGVRADGGWGSIGGWTTVGLAVSVLVLLIKSETDLVHVARAYAGRPVLADTGSAPRVRGLSDLRRVLRYLPFFRAFIAIEFTVLAFLAAVVDALHGDLLGSRGLLTLLVPLALLTVAGHLLSILTSTRLR